MDIVSAFMLCVGSSNVDALASHIEPEDVELHSKAEKSANTVCASCSVYKVYKIFNVSAITRTVQEAFCFEAVC